MGSLNVLTLDLANALLVTHDIVFVILLRPWKLR